MNLKLKVLKNGVQTHGAESSQFESIEAFEAWKQQCIDSNVWGKPERWLQDSPMSPLSEEEKAKSTKNRVVELSPEVPESKDEDGNVIPAIPAVLGTEYYFQAEYVVETEDITAKIEAEKLAKEEKKKAKEKRSSDLSKIDWSKTMTVKQLQEVVKSILDHMED